MRETVAADFGGWYSAARTTLAALYEPYRGAYYVAGPVPSLRNDPLFQPGFDYSFVECCCNFPQPADYYNTSFTYGNPVLTISKFETDYSLITHPNHTAINIKFDACDFNGQNTRKCYDNWNRAAINGKVTKFNDEIFNTNITITPQDSTAINNQNMVNDLPQGLYKIEKNYDDGAIEETVIYKQGN